MATIETTTVSESGYASESTVGDFSVSIDATGETGPDPNSLLVGDYAACFAAALRATAADHDVDLGRIQVDATAETDADDDLESVAFDVYVGAAVDEAALHDVVAGAEDLCHVHAALREGLRATVDAHADAF